jgi:hypothetical protein
MGKPTEQQLKEALAEAGRMREQGEDPHFIAKSLLSLHYRHHRLENVLHAARLYLRGMDEHQHTVLLRAIEEAVRAENEGDEDLGL